MVRPAEASNATWDEIDWEQKLWTIPKERMKRKKTHLIPLTDTVLELLRLQKEAHPSTNFVFPSHNSRNRPINSQTANSAIKRIGYKNQLVSHGLRSIASTVLNNKEFNRDIIEIQLAHIDQDKVRQTYNNADYLKQRREMLNWWSDYIDHQAAIAFKNPL